MLDKENGLNVVLEEPKQRLQAKETQNKGCDQITEAYKIIFFQQDQKRVYKQAERPDAEEKLYGIKQ